MIWFDKVHLLDPASGIDGTGCLLVENGVISRLGSASDMGKPPKDARIISADGAVLIPGLVDMRVQSRNPGFAHQESPVTLARAAAAGGITSLVCLPNTQPVLDNPDSLAALSRQGHDGIPAPRLYAYGAATQGLEDKAMAELGLLAEAGAVGFTNATGPISDSLMMRRIMDYATMLDKPVIQHAEDLALSRDGEMHEGETSARLGLRGIPAEAEEIMIARDITLARATGVRYHVAHVSTARGVDLIRKAKAEGIAITCDIAPPYYMLNDLAVMNYDTRFQLSPPLREETDRQAILEAIADGTIDCIASDHAPLDRDSKLLPFGQAAAGASGLETLLPMMRWLAREGYVSLSRAVEMVTAAPATLLDLPGGSLTPGAAADLCLFAPDRAWQVRGENFRSLSHNTPFEGQPVEGMVLSTWVDGVMIYPGEDD